MQVFLAANNYLPEFLCGFLFCVDFYLAVQTIPIIPHTPTSPIFRSWGKVLIRPNSARFLMYPDECRKSRYRSMPGSAIAIASYAHPTVSPTIYCHTVAALWHRHYF